MKRKTQEFRAKGDSGKSYTIWIYQAVIDTSDMRHGRSETLGGLKEAVTSEGHILNVVDDQTFRRVDSDEILHVIA